MKRRLLVLLTAITALAIAAPSADAFIAPIPPGAPGFGLVVDAGGTFGPGGANAVTIHGFDLVPFGTSGTVSITGTDAKGTHSYTATIGCVSSDGPATSAGILARLDAGAVGEPATLYGVLIHLTDPEPNGTTDGTGDKIDVTNLNAKQYQRQLALGCPGVPAKTSISSGNVAVGLFLPFFLLP